MSEPGTRRNSLMAQRISRSPVRYPFSFVITGDSGAWPDPTAAAIFAQLLEQTARRQPAPLFFANLGDFAGPGTPERHERYLEQVARLPVPNLCIVGNHDLDDPGGREVWAEYHGPAKLPIRLRQRPLHRHRRRARAGSARSTSTSPPASPGPATRRSRSSPRASRPRPNRTGSC
jgi:hypothetical protein